MKPKILKFFGAYFIIFALCFSKFLVPFLLFQSSASIVFYTQFQKPSNQFLFCLFQSYSILFILLTNEVVCILNISVYYSAKDFHTTFKSYMRFYLPTLPLLLYKTHSPLKHK